MISLKKFIVCTSINKPTLAIKKFDAMRDWKLVVVGDKKTPKNYKLKNGNYLSPSAQEKIDKKLSELIGWNCIQRRNFGILYAWKSGADIVAVVDDDNKLLGSVNLDLAIKSLSKSDQKTTTHRYK